MATGPTDYINQTNYAGACLFVGYIVAALVFTFRAIRHLHWKYWQLPEPHRQACHSQLRLFTPLALISFCVLSFNMLSFLLVSLHNFRARQQAISTGTLSVPSVLWEWLTTSGLFTEFSVQLVGGSESFYWTGRAVRATMLAFLYMGNAVRTLNIPSTERLDFYALAQILPPSFSLNLFFIFLILYVPPWTAAPQKYNGFLESVGALVWRVGLGTYLVMLGLTRFLDVVHSIEKPDDVLILVLVTRVLLASSTYLPFDLFFLEAYFVAATVAAICDAKVPGLTFWLFRDGSAGLYAVRALGVDNLIFTVSIVFWVLTRGNRARTQALHGGANRLQAFDLKIIGRNIGDDQYHDILQAQFPLAHRILKGEDFEQLNQQERTDLATLLVWNRMKQTASQSEARARP